MTTPSAANHMSSPRMSSPEVRNLLVLAACQALLLTNNATIVALNGLAGYALATDKSLATLPVTGWVTGAAVAALPASLLMKRIGRRAGFTIGTVLGILGALVCAAALSWGSFALLCVGTFLFGTFNGFGQFYRFAAADSVRAEFRPKAISLVLAGGLVGGLIGPELSKNTVELATVRYMGSYLSLIAFLLLSVVVVQLLRIPPPTDAEVHGPSRPLREIVAQPAFIVAAMCSAIGYGVMNLLMTATPLAMGVCGHPFSATASVIGWHVIGMFGPSLFTGSLIRRFGIASVILAGVFLLYVCVLIALSGLSVSHFWWAMFIQGIGWNFMYVGGSALLTQVYRPAEKAKAQGAHDAVVFLTMVASSLSSGYMLDRNGWHTLNYLALPLITLAGCAVLWLFLTRRTVVAA